MTGEFKSAGNCPEKEVEFQDNRQFLGRELRVRVPVKAARLHFFSRGKFSRQLVAQSVTTVESLYRNAGYSSVRFTPKVTRTAGQLRVAFNPYFLFEVGARDHMMAFNTSVHAVLSAESTLGGSEPNG